MSLTDSDLRAYLEGTSPEPVAAVIEAALARGDEVLDARLKSLDPLSTLAAGAYGDLPDAARRRMPAFPIANRKRGTTGLWAAAAALVLGIGLGWSGAWLQAPEPNAPGWRMQVALYQSLYVPESVSGWTARSFDAQFAKAETALGATLPKSALSAADGLRLKQVQVLGFKGKPLIQLIYQGNDGTPYALCLMRGEDGLEKTEVLAGLASTSWSAGGNRIILIGGNDLQAIAGLAAPLRQAMSS